MKTQKQTLMLLAIGLINLFSAPLYAEDVVDPYSPDPNPIPSIAGYHYVWGDEFNTESEPVNEDLWGFEEGFIRGNEAQYYQKDNATVTEGRLLISGRKERVKNVNYDASSGDYRKNTEYSEYTSASMLGKRKRLFLFGRIEVRAKIDPTNGTFPAIWTCGYNKNWPQNGEIDIMEYYLATMDGVPNTPVLTSNFCVGGDQNGSDGEWAQKWKSVFTKRSYYEAKDPDWINKYHVYRMDWNEKTISLYVDDELRNTVDIDEFRNWDGSIAFHNPQFMMLNLAIKNHGVGIGITDTENAIFEVDYFRVYQKTCDTEKPSSVENIMVSNVTSNTCRLSWDASTDNDGIYRYDVYVGGLADNYFKGSAVGHEITFNLSGLKADKVHNVYVLALDSVGNYSEVTNPTIVNTLAEKEIVKNIIPIGDYYIKKRGTDLYWTNTKVAGAGVSPSLETLKTDDAALTQVWTLSLDNNYYKLVNKADGRYINEKATFHTNEYYPDWNTYNIYSTEDLDCAMQITQLAATGSEWSSGGEYFWKWNANNAVELNKSHTTISGSEDLIFTLVPYSPTGIIDNKLTGINYWTAESVLNIQTGTPLTISIHNLLGVQIKTAKVNSHMTFSLTSGIYFLKFNAGNLEKTVKVMIK